MFPFKAEFYDKDQIIQTAMNKTYAELKVLNRNSFKYGPIFHSRNFDWKLNNQIIGCICKPDAYDLDILTDLFSEPARLQAIKNSQKNESKTSILEFFEKNKQTITDDAMKTFKNCKCCTNQPDHLRFRYHLREYIYKNYSYMECTTFKISWTSCILKAYSVKKVLDPSAGWGCRALGAFLAGVETYHGVDPNQKLRDSYNNITALIQKHSTKNVNFKFIEEDFLKENLTDNDYDAVFTGPPFFDYEIYSDDEKQSHKNKKNVDDWLENFLKPYVSKAFSKIRKNGKMFLYLSDIPGGNDYLQKTIFYINNFRGCKYEGCIAMNNGYGSQYWPLWVWSKF